MKMTKRLLSCMMALGMLGAITACTRLIPSEEPTTAAEATIEGHPDIQAAIDASLDKVLAVVDATAARSAELVDPRFAALSRVLRRESDSRRATERVVNPDLADNVTEKEQKEIDSLIAEHPEVNAALAEMSSQLQALYASIPTIELKVQNLNKSGNPVGQPYTIRSENGVIDFGNDAVTTQEFLLWIQSRNRDRWRRGHIIDTDWSHTPWGEGRPWPGDTVRYFLDSALSDEDKRWMRDKLHRAWHATGVRFIEYTSTPHLQARWDACRSSYLRVYRKNISSRGEATLGYEYGCRFLRMDRERDVPRDAMGERVFYHEIGHVLGLLHEHQREDRGTYIRMYDENGRTRTGVNYDRIYRWRNKRYCFWFFGWHCWYSAVRNATTYSTPYDYHSVMQYISEEVPITIPYSGEMWDSWSQNKTRWGSLNHHTYFTPWDIYTVKLRYGISPNARPTYTPRPAPIIQSDG